MSPKRKRTVVIGLFGPTLDGGDRPDRWERWRPSVSLCQHEDLIIDRFELLHQKRYEDQATGIAADIRSVSPETEVRRQRVEFRDPWAFEDVYGALHDFATRYPFDPENELYLIHVTTGTHVAQICLFILTESRYFPARLIQASPSRRKSQGTTGSYAIIDLDLSKYDKIAGRFQKEAKDDISFLKSGIETRNSAFNQLIQQIEQVAIRSQEPILMMGPTGAGKSRLARRIHELKLARRQVSGSFVEVNCATLRGDAAMSTLFGHRKGAFTGAANDREGLLKRAENGIVFLDEVGELGLDEQAMLLRAIEERTFLPLGSDAEVTSSFQLICGTNRDLPTRVAEKAFREDLLARINLWTFTLPGLCERREDIEPNLEYEMELYASRHGTRVTFNKEARDRFLKFARSNAASWPANFRDLNAAVTRMATLAPSGRINQDIVGQEIDRLTRAWSPTVTESRSAVLIDVLGAEQEAALDLFDRDQLATVIRICRSSRTMSEAGRTLFAHSRLQKKSSNDADRLRKYLARFGLSWEQAS